MHIPYTTTTHHYHTPLPLPASYVQRPPGFSCAPHPIRLVGKTLTPEGLAPEVGLYVMAGFETTASTIAWCL